MAQGNLGVLFNNLRGLMTVPSCSLAPKTAQSSSRECRAETPALPRKSLSATT